MASSLEKWTPSQVKSKADWEGGIIGLLEYGLKSENIDDSTPEGAALKAAWVQLDGLTDSIEAVAKLVYAAPDLDD